MGERLLRVCRAARGGVEVVDSPGLYTLDTFNEAARAGMLMETLDAWEGAHPGMATLPMDWGHSVPYGVVYAKGAAPHVMRFIEALSGRQTNRPGM